MRGRTGNGSADRQLRPHTLRKSGNYTALASANPRLPAGWRSAAPQFAGFWPDLFPAEIGALAFTQASRNLTEQPSAWFRVNGVAALVAAAAAGLAAMAIASRRLRESGAE
jgi:hypothetical protein